jgi:hypothetical protein
MLKMSGFLTSAAAQNIMGNTSVIVGLAMDNGIKMIDFFDFYDPSKKYSAIVGGNPDDIKIIGNYAIVAVSSN